jgi:monooxygenase
MMLDGREVEQARAMVYKGMMIRDVPNFAFATGYTNASWTLKCDLTSAYVCRLLNHMDRYGYRTATPRNTDPTVTAMPLIDFSSGYVQRSIAQLPKQGSRRPWKLFQNYALDLFTLKFGSIEDSMEFAGPRAITAAPPVEERKAA